MQNKVKASLIYLSSYHRLLPIWSVEKEIYWFGLGKYQYLKLILTELFARKRPVKLNYLTNKLKRDQNTILILYLNSNYDNLFEKDNKDRWNCNINRENMLAIEKHIICINMDKILHNMKCVYHDGNLYKLPLSSKFSDTFCSYNSILTKKKYIQVRHSEWMSWAINQILDDKCKSVLLACTTAPSEIFARSICRIVVPIEMFIFLNIGFPTEINEAKIY